jgi:DNA-binding transcriptional LysR family regulator
MPVDFVQSDLSRGSLVKIVAEDAPSGFVVSMRAVYRNDAPPGVAGRWLIERLKQGSQAALMAEAHRRKPTARKHVRRR